MRSLLILAFAIALAGCAKKTRFTGSTGDSAAVTPQPVGPTKPGDVVAKKKEVKEKPNWLTDPRVKEKDNSQDEGQLPIENQPNKPNWGLSVQAPPPGKIAPPQPTGGAQPGGVLQPAIVPQPPVPPAAGTTTGFPNLKPVAEADMKEVWIFIENASGATGRMPSSALVLAALQQAKAAALPLVVDGSITLTGATTRESVWAYETKAKTQGGWVASQNGVENLTAAELKRRLGK